MIKIGIDPSGTGTTAIAIFEDNKLIRKELFDNKDWKCHATYIIEIIWEYLYQNEIINIENCLYTSANASKDRDDLLRLLGAIEKQFEDYITLVSPRHTKSVVKNMENLSKYNDNCLWEFEKDVNLTYEYGKGWKYNNEKISNHIISANIFQCGLSGNKPRLFFSTINDNNLGIFIITPLFLDLNHAIYKSKNKNYDNKYDICLICNEKRCE